MTPRQPYRGDEVGVFDAKGRRLQLGDIVVWRQGRTLIKGRLVKWRANGQITCEYSNKRGRIVRAHRVPLGVELYMQHDQPTLFGGAW